MPKRTARKRPQKGGRRRKAQRGTPFSRFIRRWLLRSALLALIAGAGYVVWLDHTITSRFEGRRWALPAQIYARPLELYAGMRLTPAELETELGLLGYRRMRQPGRPGDYRREGSGYEIITRGFRFWDGEEPGRRIRLGFSGNRLADLRLASGGPAPLVRLEPAEIGRIHPNHNEDRILVRLDDVPSLLVKALIATEDRAYYDHFGLSLRSIARAIWSNLRAGKTVQGGSTLTQQLVKNYFLDNRRTLARKLNEAVMSLLLERRYGKDEILEAYLNEIYLGQQGRHAIHGFGLAARFYFARPLGELKLPEIALLVALVRGASYYNPHRHPERSRKRRNRVLAQMEELGMIDSKQADWSQRAGLGIVTKPPAASTRYPAFIDLVRRQLRRDYRSDDLRAEGLQIHTTLEPRIQDAAERSMGRLARLEREHRLEQGSLEGAVVVTDSAGGEVLALVGGRAPRDPGFNRALDAVRPIGSLIKPLVYLTALDRNGGYTPVSMIEDEPITLPGEKGESWSPQNYDKRPHGKVALHAALSRSYNLATVRLGMELGLRKVLRALKRAGIEREMDAYPSLLLGTGELPPIEVAQFYQTLAAGGFRIPLRSIREVTGPDHRPLSRYRLSVSEAFQPRPVYQLNTILQEAFSEGTGRSVYRRLPGRPALAGKTGTTDGLRDSWFAGFGGDRMAVVWLGRDDNRPAGLSGAGGALQVWGDLMQELSPKAWNPPLPEGLILRWVDGSSGMSTDEGCPGAVRLAFMAGTEPEYAPCGG